MKYEASRLSALAIRTRASIVGEVRPRSISERWVADSPDACSTAFSVIRESSRHFRIRRPNSSTSTIAVMTASRLVETGLGAAPNPAKCTIGSYTAKNVDTFCIVTSMQTIFGHQDRCPPGAERPGDAGCTVQT